MLLWLTHTGETGGIGEGKEFWSGISSEALRSGARDWPHYTVSHH